MATRLWIPALSVLSGVGLTYAAPGTWGVAPFHGALLGAAFYIAALRHRLAIFLRVAAFLALAGAQTYVLFVMAPGADVRAVFVILSTWIVLESVGGERAVERKERAASGY
jgi:hypothetical protein